ncbi:MAG: 4Fe-4S dicluster domain-containing protein [Planctomycetota bacterium]|jgi:carbon-monoxide dehydrogenase iron sulfur subunit
MAKAITVNIEKCLACKSCEVACALAHSKSKVLEEAVAESPKPQRRVMVEAAGEFGVPIQCRHCEDAPCITVCPTGAIHRHQVNDPVLIDKDKCIGCKFCLVVCPFGAIDITRDGKAVVKCDLCIERTKAGQEPACVEACPTKALKLADEEELAAGKRRRAAQELVISTQKSNKRKGDTE